MNAKLRFSERKLNAKSAAKFAAVADRTYNNHIKSVIVPGHDGKQYLVIFTFQAGEIAMECHTKTGVGLIPCKGGNVAVCYHMMAAIVRAAEESKKSVSFCQTQDVAERLAKLGGKVFKLVSRKNPENNLWAVIK